MTSNNPIGPVDSGLTGVVQPSVFLTRAEAPRVEVLQEAELLITGDREKDYGSPEVNFRRIADLWNVQLAALLAPGKKFEPYHVAMAMAQVKMGRAVQSPTRDSFVDATGYIGIAYELSLDNE